MNDYPNHLTAESCTRLDNLIYFGLFSLDKTSSKAGLYHFNINTSDWTLVFETDPTMVFFGMTTTNIDNETYVVTCVPSHNCIMTFNTVTKNHYFIPLRQSPNDICIDVSDPTIAHVCCNTANEVSFPNYNMIFGNNTYKVDLKTFRI